VRCFQAGMAFLSIDVFSPDEVARLDEVCWSDPSDKSVAARRPQRVAVPCRTATANVLRGFSPSPE
jgi:hypothetical protein